MPSAEERVRNAYDKCLPTMIEMQRTRDDLSYQEIGFLAGHASRDPEVAALVEALEPFARADNLDSKVVGVERLRLLRGCVSSEDFRRARTALARHRDGRR